MNAELTETETWQLRALVERRARAQLTIQAARSSYEQATQDHQRAESAINSTLLTISARVGGPADVNTLKVDMPPDDTQTGSLSWASLPVGQTGPTVPVDG